MGDDKPIYWIGSSYKDLLNFPAEAKQDAGYQLHRIQNGLNPEDWKYSSARNYHDDNTALKIDSIGFLG